MLVKASADHLSVLRPRRERDCGAVHADKAFAIVMDKREKRNFLFQVHFQFAARIEEHSVKVVQIFCVVFEFFLREYLRICPDGCSPETGFPAEALDGCNGVRNGLVPVAFFLTEYQKLLHGLSGRLRLDADAECQAGNERRYPKHLHLWSSTVSCRRGSYF